MNPPRPTLRRRITLLNGLLLVATGAGVLVTTWLMVEAGAGQAQVLLAGLAALAVLSTLGLIGGYWITARALRPLQQVTTTARRLSTETLDQRLRYSGPDDEIAELAGTFDAMLDRLASAFDSQKRFVANASHELRTPLAVMRTEVDVTLTDPEADLAEYRRMARVLRDASVRANSLVDALLLLARTEAQAGRRLARKAPVDLAVACTTALSTVQRDIARMGILVNTDLRPAPVIGDPSLLDRLAGNLVENAVRYNEANGHLWVHTGMTAEQAWLVVANTGGELDPSEVPALFEPFRRGGLERTGSRGAGLGLSIVRAVCDAHGGSVRAVARSGGGLEVTVLLPAAATTPVSRGAASVPQRH
ncbi:two-component sensor histidine kinase [Longispora fulva]|uniref:histidine kinase n=1 Tax=Longispora fulva TaxID=619741 RepID=A0A8J7GK97_9ACTN|nr:HAMP domain-containing sensor histidine kinase [Longispora fulva]MBG6138005.1 signal transduction histidine kinase [Longispora fulva]GIG60258.1 two-component sensor histidine kinase [Longispora fulva]